MEKEPYDARKIEAFIYSARADEDSRAKLYTLMENLPERDMGVLKLYFGLEFKEHTLEEIGGMLGITRERVRQLRDRSLEQLGDLYEEIGGLL